MDSKYIDDLRSKRIIELSDTLTTYLRSRGLPEDSATLLFDSLVDGLSGREESHAVISRLHSDVIDNLYILPWED